MEVSRRPVGRPRLRQTSSLFRVKFRGDALLWLIFGIDSWCKSREFSNHPLETRILRRTFMQNRKKLWRPLRSPVALRRLGNPPIPIGDLLTRHLDPPIVTRGQKRWKRMSKCVNDEYSLVIWGLCWQCTKRKCDSESETESKASLKIHSNFDSKTRSSGNSESCSSQDANVWSSIVWLTVLYTHC